MSSGARPTEAPGGAPEADGIPSRDARLDRRDECPVLPCLPHTAVNADRIDPDGSSAATVGDAGPSPRLTAALIVISAAQLMVVLDATIITVALPSIQRSLHFSAANLEWVISGYTLAFGGLLLLGGRLGDVFGRRKMFVLGLTVFSLASLAGGLATTAGWLIASRAVQGVGGAIAAPSALALIGDTFPEGPSRTRAMGVYAALSGAGGALGLLLGGILTDIASWRWVLFVNVPIGAVVAVVAPRVLGRSAQRGGQLDIPGAFAATAGTTALVYGLVRATVEGWADPVTVGSFVAAALLLFAFVMIEARSDHPILPFRLLANRNRAATYVVMAAIAGSIFAVSFFLTLLMQTVFGYSPLRTGAAFLPFSVGIAGTSEVVAKLIGRVRPRVFATAGPLVAAAALLWLSRIHLTSTYLGAVFGPLLLLSIGLGLAFVPLTLSATSGVSPADMGVASALLNTSQQVGGTLGLAVLVTVATTTTRHALRSGTSRHPLGQQAKVLALSSSVHGYSAAFVVGSGIAFAAFLVALVALRPRPPGRPVGAAGDEPHTEATRHDPNDVETMIR
jgi:EmrB/QacA subfamily drug resistance transporter